MLALIVYTIECFLMLNAFCSLQEAASLQQLHWDNYSTACTEVTFQNLPSPPANRSKPSHASNLAKTLMLFKGKRNGMLGVSIILRGASFDDLVKIKRITRMACYAAYMQRLEVSYLAALTAATSAAIQQLIKNNFKKATRRMIQRSVQVQT